MGKTRSTIWLAVIGTILFLAILWRRILRIPVARDGEKEYQERKDRYTA